jgi:hypothetical protein
LSGVSSIEGWTAHPHQAGDIFGLDRITGEKYVQVNILHFDFQVVIMTTVKMISYNINRVTSLPGVSSLYNRSSLFEAACGGCPSTRVPNQAAAREITTNTAMVVLVHDRCRGTLALTGDRLKWSLPQKTGTQHAR